MKNKLITISVSAAFLLIFASFPSVVATQNIGSEQETNSKDKISNQIKLDLLDSIKGKNTNTKWFPGFMIVQLIKGVLAFFLILMILLDIVEHKETE